MNTKLLPEEVIRILPTIQEKDLAEARETLGKTAEKMTDDDLRHQIACMQFLVESWMDEYERSIFDGKTLAEKIG